MAWVARSTNDLVLTFTDRAGKYSTVRYHIDPTETDPDAGDAALLGTTTAAISDALMSKAEILQYAVNDAPAAAAAGPFARVTDKVRLLFASEEGVQASMELPSVNEGILMPDGVTVDLADAAVIAFRDAMYAGAVTAEGDALSVFKGGYRKRNKGIKKQ